jgi:hypothetical protein
VSLSDDGSLFQTDVLSSDSMMEQTVAFSLSSVITIATYIAFRLIGSRFIFLFLSVFSI